MKKEEKGQIILILVLVMTVALAIGISVIQRSLSDISTATKVEQSSRAFSAAEAGIEKALRGDATAVSFPENNSSATVTGTDLIPAVPADGTRQDPLEYPNLAKEEIAHVWLADPDSATNPPAAFYKQPSLDIYWGNSNFDQAALELTLVYYNGSQYTTQNTKWYLDHTVTRTPDNKFTPVPCSGGYKPGTNTYQCKYTINSLPAGLMLIRARLLYNSSSQPFAVHAVGICGADCSLPPQARKLIATGISGQTQRRIQVFRLDKVVPPYFPPEKLISK